VIVEYCVLTDTEICVIVWLKVETSVVAMVLVLSRVLVMSRVRVRVGPGKVCVRVGPGKVCVRVGPAMVRVTDI
jgi:hypothetical protein